VANQVFIERRIAGEHGRMAAEIHRVYIIGTGERQPTTFGHG
jgi:hypothetical protein